MIADHLKSHANPLHKINMIIDAKTRMLENGRIKQLYAYSDTTDYAHQGEMKFAAPLVKRYTVDDSSKLFSRTTVDDGLYRKLAEPARV